MAEQFQTPRPLGITIRGTPGRAKKYLKLSACDQKGKDSEDVLMESRVYRLKILVSSMQEFQAVLLRRVSENLFQYITSDKPFHVKILCNNSEKKKINLQNELKNVLLNINTSLFIVHVQTPS